MTRGYDNYRPNQVCLLDLQLRETTGTTTIGFGKPYHTATLTGPPTWATLANDLTYLDFNPATPDRLVIAAASSTALDFTSGDFSGAVWIAPDAYGNRYLMDKSGAAVGWAFWISGTSPYLAVTTANAGPLTQTTYGGTGLVLSSWQFVGFTRSGAAAKIYLNGVNVTTTPATHVNPASAAAVDFTIGTIVGAGAGWYDGKLWRPRVWGRQLAGWEMATIYAEERNLFGV